GGAGLGYSCVACARASGELAGAAGPARPVVVVVLTRGGGAGPRGAHPLSAAVTIAIATARLIVPPDASRRTPPRLAPADASRSRCCRRPAPPRCVYPTPARPRACPR